MRITLTGQLPATLEPTYVAPLSGDYDPPALLRKGIVEPLFQPLHSQPVTILDDKGQPALINGNPFDETEFMHQLLTTMQEDVNPDAESLVKQVYSQGLISYDPSNTLLANSVFAVQAANQVHPAWPSPSPMVMYTAATDVIPAAKLLLTDQSRENEFFAALAYTYTPKTLGFWFLDEAAFADFQTSFATDVQNATIAGLLSQDCIALASDFQNLKLKQLTEGLSLRRSDIDGNEEGSFPRLLVHSLMKHRQAQVQAGTVNMGPMAFRIDELYIPQSIVFANVEYHARSTKRKIDNEWNLINAMLSSKIKVVSNRKISKLTAMVRQQARVKAIAGKGKNVDSKAASVKFRKKAPTSLDITADIIRVLKRLKNVSRSQNIFKKSKTSFLRANRRHPNDPNRPGRIVSTAYARDIHIFLDTSGSISESNYQDAVQTLIVLAKKMNVNLYFTSFSHMLSQPVLLKVKGKSVNAIWNEFRRIPKVTGGTNYAQIWDFINANPKRKERFSLIITDFEYFAPTETKEHPPYLYYAPVSGTSWNRLVSSAKTFVQSMNHIDATVTSKLIGVTV